MKVSDLKKMMEEKYIKVTSEDFISGGGKSNLFTITDYTEIIGKSSQFEETIIEEDSIMRKAYNNPYDNRNYDEPTTTPTTENYYAKSAPAATPVSTPIPPKTKINEFSIEVLEGYKPLTRGVTTRKGDIYFESYSKQWRQLVKGDLGVPFRSGWPQVYRKIINLNYTQEKTNSIINFLTVERAFNEDSAFEIEGNDLDIYLDLSEKNIIKCIDENRFYVEK